MKQPDILIYMSDQHSPLFSGWGPVPVDTPNLNDMIRHGTNFTESYTSCPLCVPARMSMLASKLPAKTGVYTNFDTLPDTTPTFLHPLVAAGYETVLIGRMHFIGKDQRHGFTKRLVGDITPVTWNRPVEKLAGERGVFFNTFTDMGCMDVIGGGESPVLHYDEEVVQSALEYLNQEHEKPQFILVGTYGPHYPYVAPKELYQKYLERVEIPESFDHNTEMGPLLEKRKQPDTVGSEEVKKAMAAYCGMIEHMDMQIGQVRSAWKDYGEKTGRDTVFCYLSDHGDQVGENRMFGKQTFFEKSAKIPMIFEGTGICAGQQVKTPVSIMDLGPTVCALAGTEFSLDIDGVSQHKVLLGEAKADSQRVVISQFMDGGRNSDFTYGIMIRKEEWKFISYHQFEEWDMLFNISENPDEKENLIERYPVKVRELREIARQTGEPGQQEKLAKQNRQMFQWMQVWERETGMDEPERWNRNPESARDLPELR